MKLFKLIIEILFTVFILPYLLFGYIYINNLSTMLETNFNIYEISVIVGLIITLYLAIYVFMLFHVLDFIDRFF
jgi:hypothetical protein